MEGLRGKITPQKNEKLFFMKFFVKKIANHKVIYFWQFQLLCFCGNGVPNFDETFHIFKRGNYKLWAPTVLDLIS